MHSIKFKLFSKFEDVLRHGISTREGGVSEGHLSSLNLGLDVDDSEENLAENYQRFCSVVGIDENKLALANQQHTDNILLIKDLADLQGKFGWKNPHFAVDGFITNLKDLPLSVRFADCQGVLLFDPIKKVVAAIHCGWRGNIQNIIGNAVRLMMKEFDCSPENILVGISQSLGPCCAEFTDPAKELPGWMQKYVNENRHVDFWQCSFDQLTRAGINEKNIEILRRCTVCEKDKFFSYRGGKKKTGHMAAVIELIQ